jgi:hypothetical protein
VVEHVEEIRTDREVDATVDHLAPDSALNGDKTLNYFFELVEAVLGQSPKMAVNRCGHGRFRSGALVAGAPFRVRGLHADRFRACADLSASRAK